MAQTAGPPWVGQHLQVFSELEKSLAANHEAFSIFNGKICGCVVVRNAKSGFYLSIHSLIHSLSHSHKHHFHKKNQDWSSSRSVSCFRWRSTWFGCERDSMRHDFICLLLLFCLFYLFLGLVLPLVLLPSHLFYRSSRPSVSLFLAVFPSLSVIPASLQDGEEDWHFLKQDKHCCNCCTSWASRWCSHQQPHCRQGNTSRFVSWRWRNNFIIVWPFFFLLFRRI